MFKEMIKSAVRKFENLSIYYPDKQLAATPADIGLEFDDLNITTEDGVRLNAWYIPAESSDTLWLFFHGNAGNIAGRLEYCQLLNREGYSVVIVDYRGYGKSEGIPDEEGLYADAAAVYDYVIKHYYKNNTKLVYFGRSLGGAVAIHLAAQFPPDALIVENTFTSARDMSKLMYPFIPVSGFLNVSFDSLSKISKIMRHLLIIHSGRDEIVPLWMGEKLYKNAGISEKSFLLVPGAGHNDAWLVGGDEYWKRIRTFLKQYVLL